MPRITVEPERAMLDTELHIRVAELPPHQSVTVRSAGADGLGRPLAASATFETDADGVVDLAVTAPTSGTYASVDPMGLVWSMSLVLRPDDGAQLTGTGRDLHDGRDA